MKKINKLVYKGLDQEVYYEKLPNGLDIYILPFNNKKTFTAHYITRYGSNDLNFTIGNKSYQSNEGIAHFLEHKLFEQEDGSDAFSFFSKSGSYANAYTNYTRTAYLFRGVENFYENLDFLVSYVNSPFFTKENVDKEKGIIKEEITMYDDYPEWIISEKGKELVLEKHPMRISIAGSVKSINKITKDELYDCYNAFYQPSNMFLVLSGPIEIKKAMDIIKNNKALLNRKSNIQIERRMYKEPNKINEKEKIIEMNIANEKLAIIYKTEIPDNIDRYSFYVTALAYYKILFGSTSVFNEVQEQKNNFINFDYYLEQTDNHLLTTFVIETKKEKEILEELFNTFNKEITKEELNILKKSFTASNIMSTEDNIIFIDEVVELLSEYNDLILNKHDYIKKLSLEKIKQFKDNFNVKNYSVLKLVPKNTKK